MNGWEWLWSAVLAGIFGIVGTVLGWGLAWITENKRVKRDKKMMYDAELRKLAAEFIKDLTSAYYQMLLKNTAIKDSQPADEAAARAKINEILASARLTLDQITMIADQGSYATGIAFSNKTKDLAQLNSLSDDQVAEFWQALNNFVRSVRTAHELKAVVVERSTEPVI